MQNSSRLFERRANVKESSPLAAVISLIDVLGLCKLQGCLIHVTETSDCCIYSLKVQYKLEVLEEDEHLSAYPLEDFALLIIACPRQLFLPSDVAAISHHVGSGGSLLVLAERGGDRHSGNHQ